MTQQISSLKLYPFGSTKMCPKCGKSDFNRRWYGADSGRDSIFGLFGIKWDYPERLAVTCDWCGFRRYEYPADASK